MTNEAAVLEYFSDEMSDEAVKIYNGLHADEIEQAIHSLMAAGRLVQTEGYDYEVAV